MAKIIINKQCEVFQPKCTCGQEMLQLECPYLMQNSMFVMDPKGWLYETGPGAQPIKAVGKISVDAQCGRCNAWYSFRLDFDCGILVGWSDISRLQALSLGQDNEAARLQVDQAPRP
jgi:hypothetical protein